MKKVLLVTTFLLMSLFATLAMAVDSDTTCPAEDDGPRVAGSQEIQGETATESGDAAAKR